MTVELHRDFICLPPGRGRRYAIVRLTALFEADGVSDGFVRNMPVIVN